MTSIREMVRLADVEKAVEQLPGLQQQVDELQRQVTEQAERIESLRAQLGAVQTCAPADCTEARQLPECLREINSSRQTRCERLREAIDLIVAQHPNPTAITGKEVEKELERGGFTPMPKGRTVRTHLAAARTSMATHGRTENGQKSV